MAGFISTSSDSTLQQGRRPAQQFNRFSPLPLGNRETLLVPSITIYEVFKVVCRQKGEDAALQATALMLQGTVAELSPSLAMMAAKVSLEQSLPMADSIILATARLHNAILWTQDQHFAGIPDVRYFPPLNNPSDPPSL